MRFKILHYHYDFWTLIFTFFFTSKNWSPDHRKLPNLSADYVRVFGMYQGITNPSAAPPSFVREMGALDLYALSTPPAFILDQDQILAKNKSFWDN